MFDLKRAPKECGSWFWDLDGVAKPGLAAALTTAARMCEVLSRHALLEPYRLEYQWGLMGRGGVGITTTLALTYPLGSSELPGLVIGSQPVAYPEADPGDIHVVGEGVWIDGDGRRRREHRLVDLSVSSDDKFPSAELSVHHDIWGWFDFSGRPHEAVYQHNAPRLAQVLSDLSATVGVIPEVGESTYFGTPTETGIASPDPDENGLGPDLSDWVSVHDDVG